MQLVIKGGLVTSIKALVSKRSEWRGQLVSILDDNGGGVEILADDGVDFSKVPKMVPVNMEISVNPSIGTIINQAGYPVSVLRLRMTGFSIEKRKEVN